ncbi:bifunctional YncE family protein/alkaline phosphatase family protein [Prolixibacteraceae bacterium Z1-6]|uniref:Bifunctional YncE family protein/alkaline phosphatase family protein n=1 Tax=Draconibacterium aestuarii TaxID=2998507 RepID=A0A9X3J6G1_9BACT|nr:bifunctional YncE family protein/alkaline phosphatase family protein [Prolixibacteraceae bacterium Z1-6]
MKNLFRLSFFLFLTLSVFSGEAQTNIEKAKQDKHLSDYEGQTLAGDQLPVLMPFNRWIDPAGQQVYFGDEELENHALDCAASPDGKWIAVEGRYSIVVISARTKKIVHRFVLSSYFGGAKVINTFSGITWHKTDNDYKLIWSAAGNGGKSYVVSANWRKRKLEIDKTFILDAVPPARNSLANELIVSEENGEHFIYVVLNGNNTLKKIDLNTGEIVWKAATGVAPFGINKANGKLYVTNWAGSVPDENDKNVAGVPWGKAKVDPETGATREGSVSVFNPANGTLLNEIIVGLHPNDIIPSPDENYIYVANANSDAISVINTKTDAVVETIPVKLGHEQNPYFGDSPNGLGISSDGKTLYVAVGMDNAIAVVDLGDATSFASKSNASKVAGFIPTGAYPGAVCVYSDKLLYVANIEAEGARIPRILEETGTKVYNSHHQMASVSIIPVPDKNQLKRYTERVKETNQFFRVALSKEMPRENVDPVPVPTRIGEPSVFKHVVYIIKENRTYDQLLGDVKAGDGDSSLCIFGAEVTPNTHKLTEDFLLLDNFHVAGKSSAEGHQWTDMAIVTDYIEKNVRGWFRSYPHVQEDALVYAPTGFIWDNALRHGKSVRIYGEACVPEFDKNATWESIYNQFKNGEKVEFRNKTTIDPVKNILSQNYPGYDSHKFPDVLRAKTFIDELHQYEQQPGDQWPELIIVALPNDHTAGTRPGFPTPRAMVADNDLALGQIIEAISNSRFWENTAIFVTEDDSQAGWDHVSAYRTVGLVASPYTRFNKTNHTNYNQVSMIRTIEQILGIPPMNIQDATAMPMFDCFTNVADNSSYVSVTNQIPLDEMNKDLSQLKGQALHYAKKSMYPQFDRVDSGNDALFNRIVWFAEKGKEPYPAKYSGKDDDDDD